MYFPLLAGNRRSFRMLLILLGGLEVSPSSAAPPLRSRRLLRRRRHGGHPYCKQASSECSARLHFAPLAVHQSVRSPPRGLPKAEEDSAAALATFTYRTFLAAVPFSVRASPHRGELEYTPA